MDEKPIHIGGGAKKILTFVDDGAKKPPSTVQTTLNSHYTVVFCISAHGDATKPAFLFPLKNDPEEAEPYLGRIQCYSTGFGYMQAEFMRRWALDVFLPKVTELRTLHHQSDAPIFLILDNHASRRDSQLLTSLADNNITVFTLPSNSTFVLQPLDLVFNGAFQNHFRSKFLSCFHGSGVAVERFVLLSAVWDAFLVSCQSKTITAGFKQADIYPLDQIQPLTSNGVISGDEPQLKALPGGAPDTRGRVITQSDFIKEVIQWENKKNK